MSAYYEDLGYIHTDDLPDLAHIKDHLEGVVIALYETGNVADLENSLEEVLHQFKLSIPKGKPHVS